MQILTHAFFFYRIKKEQMDPSRVFTSCASAACATDKVTDASKLTCPDGTQVESFHVSGDATGGIATTYYACVKGANETCTQNQYYCGMSAKTQGARFK